VPVRATLRAARLGAEGELAPGWIAAPPAHVAAAAVPVVLVRFRPRAAVGSRPRAARGRERRCEARRSRSGMTSRAAGGSRRPPRRRSWRARQASGGGGRGARNRGERLVDATTRHCSSVHHSIPDTPYSRAAPRAGARSRGPGASSSVCIPGRSESAVHVALPAPVPRPRSGSTRDSMRRRSPHTRGRDPSRPRRCCSSGDVNPESPHGPRSSDQLLARRRPSSAASFPGPSCSARRNAVRACSFWPSWMWHQPIPTWRSAALGAAALARVNAASASR
jgi:hypothetical protein